MIEYLAVVNLSARIIKDHCERPRLCRKYIDLLPRPEISFHVSTWMELTNRLSAGRTAMYSLPTCIAARSQIQAEQITEQSPINAMFHVTLSKPWVKPINLKLSLGNIRLV